MVVIDANSFVLSVVSTQQIRFNAADVRVCWRNTEESNDTTRRPEALNPRTLNSDTLRASRWHAFLQSRMPPSAVPCFRLPHTQRRCIFTRSECIRLSLFALAHVLIDEFLKVTD